MDTAKINDHAEIRAMVEKKVENERAKYAAIETEKAQRFSSPEVLKALNANEDGDAWLYIELNRGLFCFDHAGKRWYRWAGNYWERDLLNQAAASIEAVINIYGVEAERQAWARSDARRKQKNEEEKRYHSNEDALFKRIKDLQTVKRKENILHASSFGVNSLGITGQEWDSDPWVLGCRNGIVDLKTGTFRSGKPKDYIKTVSPIEWKGIDEPTPCWEQFLNNIFDQDQELIGYIQRLLGYAVTGSVSEHIYPIFWGKGRNGKGTLMETIAYVLGGLAGPIQAEMMLAQQFNRSSGGPTSDVMFLRGKRLVWASETGKGRSLNPSKIKWFTGGDTLTGREPYGREQITFTPTHKLILLTNDKPHTPADDFALWQRIHLVPFRFSFVDNPVKKNERKRDPDLPEKLKEEAPGILAWLVRGCLAWREDGLTPPEIIRAATDEFQQEEDVIGQFIMDRCVIRANAMAKAGELREEYETWCEENGEDAVSKQSFAKELLRQFDRIKTGRHRKYIGIGIKEDQ